MFEFIKDFFLKIYYYIFGFKSQNSALESTIDWYFEELFQLITYLSTLHNFPWLQKNYYQNKIKKLLSEINKINSQKDINYFYQSQSIIHIAVKGHNLELLNFIINDLEADINIQEYLTGNTPLHNAIKYNKIEYLNLLLLDENCDLNLRNSTNNSEHRHMLPFDIAITENNKIIFNKISFYTKYFDKSFNQNYYNSLHYAVIHKYSDSQAIESQKYIIDELIKNNFSFNERFITEKEYEKNSLTPLHLIIEKDNYELFEYIINKYKNQIDFNITDNRNITLLSYATLCYNDNSIKFAKKLIDLNVRLDTQATDGNTIIHYLTNTSSNTVINNKNNELLQYLFDHKSKDELESLFFSEKLLNQICINNNKITIYTGHFFNSCSTLFMNICKEKFGEETFIRILNAYSDNDSVPPLYTAIIRTLDTKDIVLLAYLLKNKAEINFILPYSELKQSTNDPRFMYNSILELLANYNGLKGSVNLSEYCNVPEDCKDKELIQNTIKEISGINITSISILKLVTNLLLSKGMRFIIYDATIESDRSLIHEILYNTQNITQHLKVLSFLRYLYITLKFDETLHRKEESPIFGRIFENNKYKTSENLLHIICKNNYLTDYIPSCINTKTLAKNIDIKYLLKTTMNDQKYIIKKEENITDISLPLFSDTSSSLDYPQSLLINLFNICINYNDNDKQKIIKAILEKITIKNIKNLEGHDIRVLELIKKEINTKNDINKILRELENNFTDNEAKDKIQIHINYTTRTINKLTYSKNDYRTLFSCHEQFMIKTEDKTKYFKLFENLKYITDPGCIIIDELCSICDADVNAIDHEGMTPLTYAIKHLNVPFIKMLLENGANLQDTISKETYRTHFNVSLSKSKKNISCKKLIENNKYLNMIFQDLFYIKSTKSSKITNIEDIDYFKQNNKEVFEFNNIVIKNLNKKDKSSVQNIINNTNNIQTNIATKDIFERPFVISLLCRYHEKISQHLFKMLLSIQPIFDKKESKNEKSLDHYYSDLLIITSLMCREDLIPVILEKKILLDEQREKPSKQNIADKISILSRKFSIQKVSDKVVINQEEVSNHGKNIAEKRTNSRELALN